MFFRDDWAHAIYHDRFQELVHSLRAMLAGDEGGMEVLDLLLRALEDGKDDATISSLRSNAVGPAGEKLMVRTPPHHPTVPLSDHPTTPTTHNPPTTHNTLTTHHPPALYQEADRDLDPRLPQEEQDYTALLPHT